MIDSNGKYILLGWCRRDDHRIILYAGEYPESAASTRTAAEPGRTTAIPEYL
jgi:hypothetical protein